jgi:hypothetical protein
VDFDKARLYSPSPGLCQGRQQKEPENPLSVIDAAMEFCEERDSPTKGGAA